MITAEHSSGRYDVTPAKLKTALTQQLADKPHIWTGTELMAEDRAAVLTGFPAYDVVRGKGTDGADECAMLVLRSRNKVISHRTVKLSDLPIPRRSGKFDYALVVVLEDQLTAERHTRIVVHRPSGVQGDGGLEVNAQGDCYRAGTGGLRRLVASISGPLVITGDQNLDLRVVWVRDYFKRHFPTFTPTWRAGDMPEWGTRGDRVIDFSLVRGFSVTAAQVVSSFGASDHRAIRETHKETPVTAPDPYAHATFRGRPLDNATIAALKIAEHRLGYELTITQGIGGAAASAGTHTEGRAVDLAAYDHERKVKVLKDLGFAVWYRPFVSGLWGAHVHGILIFGDRSNSRGLADVGFRQIASFDAKRDGLKSNASDATYRPDPKAVFTKAEYEGTFVVPVPRIEPTHVSKARNFLVEAIHNLGQALAELDSADEKRVKAKAQMEGIRADRQDLKARLAALPER